MKEKIIIALVAILILAAIVLPKYDFSKTVQVYPPSAEEIQARKAHYQSMNK